MERKEWIETRANEILRNVPEECYMHPDFAMEMAEAHYCHKHGLEIPEGYN